LVRTVIRTLLLGLLTATGCVAGLTGCTSSGHPAFSSTPPTTSSPTVTASSPSPSPSSSDAPSTSSESEPATTSAAPASPTTTAPGSSAAVASIVLTYAGWNPTAQDAEVAAYVQALQPTGGTCTLTMTHSGTTRTQSKAATPDVSTTQCGTIAIPGSQLSSGQWTATVSYSSASATGTSTPVTIEVP
jgi:hypothetical protein